MALLQLRLENQRMTAKTRAVYRQTWKWFLKQYASGTEQICETGPVQAFLKMLHARKPDFRLRVVQSILNNHLSPRPQGPPVELLPTHKESTPTANAKKTAQQRQNGGSDAHWLGYLPRHLTFSPHPLSRGWGLGR